jgi:hypothetical protein
MINYDLVLFLIILLTIYFLFRMFAMRKWIAANIFMKKGSRGKYSPGGSGDDFHNRMEERMRLKKHRVALRRAKNEGRPPGKKL